MSKLTKRADLLIAAGNAIKMQETAGVHPVCKLMGTVCSLSNVTIDVHGLSDLEFPLV